MSEDEINEARVTILQAIADTSSEAATALERLCEQAWRYANLLD